MVPPYETTPGRHGVSAALEFAVQVLGVKEIIVLGHGMCGGCRAALTRELHGTAPGEGGFIADYVVNVLGQKLMSGAIERDESTGNPYFVRQGNYGWSVWCLADDGAGKTRASRKTFPTKDAAIEYMLTVAPSREPEIRQVLYRRFPVPDRETGALKRLAAIMARYPQLSAYVQGDPRGAALYILRPGDVPEGGQADAYYSRGIAVYR